MTDRAEIVCPGCAKVRPRFDSPPRKGEWVTRMSEYLPCCNPQCKGLWGTGCWHCHHPSYAPSKSALRRLAKRFRNREARELWRVAPRGAHYGLDRLSEKADRAEPDRDSLPSLPRWQRGEWRHISQRLEAER